MSDAPLARLSQGNIFSCVRCPAKLTIIHRIYSDDPLTAPFRRLPPIPEGAKSDPHAKAHRAIVLINDLVRTGIRNGLPTYGLPGGMRTGRRSYRRENSHTARAIILEPSERVYVNCSGCGKGQVIDAVESGAVSVWPESRKTGYSYGWGIPDRTGYSPITQKITNSRFNTKRWPRVPAPPPELREDSSE